MKRFFKWFAIVMAILFVLTMLDLIDLLLIETMFLLLFGWIAGIFRLLGGLRHEPVAVGIGLVALILLPIALHLFVRNLRGVTIPWKFRQSIGVCGVFCSFMIATIGMIAMIHEVYWIAHPKENLLGSSMNTLYRDVNSRNQLKQLGIATLNFSGTHLKLPAGGTLLNDGQQGHGWMTYMLPYLEHHREYEKLDLTKPWNAPENAEVFKDVFIHDFQSYKITAGNDAEGYQLTDYAANEQVMPFGRSLHMSDITDGTANTILCGEAIENLQPWASPFNGRDPALGINRLPHGFGYEKPYRAANFAMCDGSVQSFSATTDPEILKALATPNGGESVVP